MFRNVIISLSLIGFCACTHNPEISVAKQTTPPTYAKSEVGDNFVEMIYKDVDVTPVKCYNWIPLDYKEEVKELNINKNKKQ